MLHPKIFLGVIIISINLFAIAGKSEKFLRDPFNLPSKSISKKRVSDVKLLGIICCKNKFGAIVQSKDTTETVFPGDTFMAFKILDIKSDRIILSKRMIKKEIFIE